MKQLILLLFMSTTMIACNDDENTGIKYSESNGYMSNLESVQYGIVGRWRTGATADIQFNSDGTGCSGAKEEETLANCDLVYEIVQRENKFILRNRNSSYPDGYWTESEINTLNKTTFMRTYLDDNKAVTSTRVSEPR